MNINSTAGFPVAAMTARGCPAHGRAAEAQPEQQLDQVALGQYGREIGCPYLVSMGQTSGNFSAGPATGDLSRSALTSAALTAATAGIGVGTVAAGCPKMSANS